MAIVHRFIPCAALFLLSGCIAFPPIAPKPVGNEHYLTCSQLTNSFREAQGFYEEAQREDRFRMSYLFPPSGMLSVYNIIRAKSRATERMEYIQQVKQQKQCPESGGMNMQQGGYAPDTSYMPQGQGGYGGYAPPPPQGGYAPPMGRYAPQPQPNTYTVSPLGYGGGYSR